MKNPFVSKTAALRHKASKALGAANTISLLTAWMLIGCGQADDAANVSGKESKDLVTVDLSHIYTPPGSPPSTQAPIELVNLENTAPEPVMELQLPAGAGQNVALDKPVTSSDPYPFIGDLELVTDGVASTNDGMVVELAPGLQWVQIDLETVHEIFAILVWHSYQNEAAYKQVVVQISESKEFQNENGTSADPVVTVFNSDHDGSSGLGLPAGTDPAYVETMHGRVIEVNGVKGRYVRLYSDGNTNDEINRYSEVMVYGRPLGGEAAGSEEVR